MRFKNLILFGVAAVMFTSCSMNSGLINQFTTYNNGTNVVLQEANFKVIGDTTGVAVNQYVFGFGGFKNLVSLAKQDLVKNARLEGTSRAITNMSLEVQKSRMGMVVQHKVIVHGTIIEFTK